MLNICNLKLRKKGVKICAVLVIEPDLIYQFILKSHLNDSKINFDFVEDLNEALIMASNKTYSLIFLDIPYLIDDVIDLIVKLRKLDANKTIPIIGLALMLRKPVVERILDAGLCQVVIRPYNLTLIIRHYLAI